MSETVSEALKEIGLSNEQASRLIALQEAGRKIDFVHHYTDDGSDARPVASQFDEFRNRLVAFSDEGELPLQLAAALWDHLVPRFVGWRPEFAEGVDTRSHIDLLTRVDQGIDAKLERNIAPEVRAVSQAVRARFDDLLIAYELGTWRDSRTSGEVRDELVFVASLDEKIRSVLYAGAQDVDLRRTIENCGSGRGVGDGYVFDTALEVRAYNAQLSRVSDLLAGLRAAGVRVRAGLASDVSPRPQRLEQVPSDKLTPARVVITAGRKESVTEHRAFSDADRYWLSVAHSASVNSRIERSESLIQPAQRGRSL